jgi:hypothetical protein
MVSSTRRTAGCGPACPVVWQGRVGDHSPYADLRTGAHSLGGSKFSSAYLRLRLAADGGHFHLPTVGAREKTDDPYLVQFPASRSLYVAKGALE